MTVTTIFDTALARLGLSSNLLFLSNWTPRSFAALSVPIVVLYLLRRWQRARAKLPLPPCPPKKGFLGHVDIMPTSFEYYAYGKWAKELSEFLYP